MVHGNYDWLIKDKTVKVSQGELVELWANIKLEYLDLNEANEGLYLLRLESEISNISLHIFKVESILYVLTTGWHTKLIDALKAMEYDYPFDHKDLPAYFNSIQSVQNRLSGKKLRLQIKRKELDEYMKGRQNESVSEQYFKKMLTRLARHMRVMVIRATDITVSEFVSLVADYLEEIKINNKLAENGRTRDYK